jgi:hypothetical protein
MTNRDGYTRFVPMSRALVVLVASLAFAGACGSHQGQSSFVAGGDVTIQQKANGTTVHVQPRDTLHFVLADKLDWKIRSYPRAMMRLAEPPTQGRFELQVRRAGAGTVEAVGVRSCAKGETCPATAVSFSVRILAAWIP